MSPRGPIEYEPIRPPKKGRAYPYKCRYCGGPATHRETFASRDRRRFRVPWCICDDCLRAGRDGGNPPTVQERPT